MGSLNINGVIGHVFVVDYVVLQGVLVLGLQEPKVCMSNYRLC